ncbi:hypothetical protein QBZ16_000374 [Prototheca wickerhamii]|uniref:proline--tRNA ligase n=1 Tax=Prototheca wickerhamii TaxID=3111 RepID=A0AAD9MP80_PROWI|nr:hypothetical protein QBZ16_000374 [Prototheca wickerhamii]
MVGGLLMTHGDDAGIRLPPNMAPVQVVVCATRSAPRACGARLDDDPDRTPGWKFNHWEMKGVPLRIEIGARDLESASCVLARRDRPGKQGKERGVALAPESLVPHVQTQLEEIQAALLEDATRFRDGNIVDVSSYAELRAAVDQGKWARGFWAGSDEEEVRVKEETGATLRCFPLDREQDRGVCFLTGQPQGQIALFAKAY